MPANAHPLPAAALDADIAILGKKGRGKTFTAKGLVEQLLQMHRRVVVLDPLSVWWGLKSSADGKSPGYPIPVFSGPHGDIPITGESGPALGQLLTGTHISAVLDLGQMRKAEQARLVADLLDHLFTVNRDPMWLILEEADAFAPQQPMGDMTRVLGEVDRIARRGRNFGFRLISITQRPAKLNKDVLTQLSTLIALGVTSPQDRDAIKAWVDGNADRDKARDVYDSLAHLKVGEGWIWAPDHALLKRVKFPPIVTLDTSKTPKAGDVRITAPVLAHTDIAKLKATFARIESGHAAPTASRPKRAKPLPDYA
jgi:DNA helicase HerA-like ATPase